ncbi:MAG: hypothetical protein LC731_08795, partial [Acidobacteria bacterium]|nr:hypothetical protein [Acidobacteriota bacterium]
DPEDSGTNAMPASAMTWTVVFHHDDHTHPFLTINGQMGGSFLVPTLGEVSQNVWFRIHLRVTDSSGATNITFVDIFPRKSTMTFATSPAGLQITLDGQPRNTPLAVEGVVNMTRTLSVASPQTLNGVTYYFNGWSDGNTSQTRTISTPENNTTYTAIFTTQNPTPPPTPTPSPTPSPAPRTPVSVTDDFNDNARDTARWNLGIFSKPASGFDSQVSVAERNQRLEITPRASVTGNHYNGYVTSSLYDLTGGSVSVEVLQATNSSANTIFAIGIGNLHGYRIVVEDGRLYFQALTGAGWDTQGSVPYNSTMHRFWRIRHETAQDHIVFETGSNGTNWNVMRSLPRHITLGNVRVELSAGTFTP